MGKRYQESKTVKAHNAKIPMEGCHVFNIPSRYDPMPLILETSSPIVHHWSPNLRTLAGTKHKERARMRGKDGKLKTNTILTAAPSFESESEVDLGKTLGKTLLVTLNFSTW